MTGIRGAKSKWTELRNFAKSAATRGHAGDYTLAALLRIRSEKRKVARCSVGTKRSRLFGAFGLLALCSKLAIPLATGNNTGNTPDHYQKQTPPCSRRLTYLRGLTPLSAFLQFLYKHFLRVASKNIP